MRCSEPPMTKTTLQTADTVAMMTGSWGGWPKLGLNAKKAKASSKLTKAVCLAIRKQKRNAVVKRQVAAFAMHGAWAAVPSERTSSGGHWCGEWWWELYSWLSWEVINRRMERVAYALCHAWRGSHCHQSLVHNWVQWTGRKQLGFHSQWSPC